MLYLGTTEWLDLPASIWVSLLLFAIGIVVLGYTHVGRSLYAIGGNPAAAKAAGIRVDRVVWCTLIVGSILAAFAGILLAGRLGSVAAESGNGWIFTVFAGAVIGGISMNGGKGTITGILLLYIVQNVLTLGGVNADWINFLDGVIILGALVISRVASWQAQTT
jgi:simple sugar transport system permease protein